MVFALLATVGGQTAYIGACTFAEVNQGAWININLIVILLALVLGAGIYAIAVLLPGSTREKLRGAVKVEVFQAIISLFIIVILLGFALTTCQAGQALTSELTLGTYQSPMQFAQYYMSNLLFERTQQIFGELYAYSAIFLIYGHLSEQILESLEIPIAGQFAQLQPGINVTGVFFGYTGVLTGTYTAMLVAAYAVLFIFYLLLPIVQALALTVLLPLTLVIRSWPFGGPRLREAANSFMAIAIAFYFILPLAITLNNYIVTWTYCDNNYVGTGTPTVGVGQNCNPYASYVAFTQFATLPQDTFFDANTVVQMSGVGAGQGVVNVPFSFSSLLTGAGGFGSVLTSTFKILFEVPTIITMFGYQIAEFMFEAIVLVALDIAITIGFAQGLAKGLGAIPAVLAGGPSTGASGTPFGPFWGNV